MNSDGLQSEISAGGVATIVLNRPELGNRYNDAMLIAFGRLLALFADDGAVHIVVIKGSGRHFCVGADIGWHQANQSHNPEVDEPDRDPQNARPLPEADIGDTPFSQFPRCGWGSPRRRWYRSSSGPSASANSAGMA